MKPNVTEFNDFINGRRAQLEDEAFEKQKAFFEHLQQRYGIQIKEVLDTITFVRDEIPLWTDLLIWELHTPDDGTTHITLSHFNKALRALELDKGLSEPVPYPTDTDTTPLVTVLFTPPKGVTVLKTLDDPYPVLKILADSIFDATNQSFIAPVAYVPLYYIRCVVEQAIQMRATDNPDQYQAKGHLHDGTGFSLTFYRKECLMWKNWHSELYAQL